MHNFVKIVFDSFWVLSRTYHDSIQEATPRMQRATTLSIQTINILEQKNRIALSVELEHSSKANKG